MAAPSTSNYFRVFTFSILFFKTLAFDPIPLFSYAEFGKDLKFKPNVALYGNAKVFNDGSGIHFSGSGSSDTGRVMYKKPIKLFQVVAKISNKLALTSGENMHAWIDYEASSRRLEVRLSQHGKSRPSVPLLWRSIDLSNVLKENEMFAGFSSVKGNYSQACFLYSWSFVLRSFPHSMHSEPLDPKVFVKSTESPVVKQRSDCFLRVLAAMIFGTGCGALTAFIVLYLWTIFGNKRAVVPEETVMQPVDVEYRKVKIVVDKTIQDSKN
ncbi:hypothetical protein VIGAN_09066900 [Vigna angularis var. angularis]|uniref:Legume lectin domain-containing protein n=1 Tax=Vigna angularis var. angularis TaxID=157739 RepID=A0A0S3SWY6_PHAAN|nr:hypothetical protein VIGAN_09066900 [Vigna angularis var. angularis]